MGRCSAARRAGSSPWGEQRKLILCPVRWQDYFSSLPSLVSQLRREGGPTVHSPLPQPGRMQMSWRNSELCHLVCIALRWTVTNPFICGIKPILNYDNTFQGFLGTEYSDLPLSQGTLELCNLPKVPPVSCSPGRHSGNPTPNLWLYSQLPNCLSYPAFTELCSLLGCSWNLLHAVMPSGGHSDFSRACTCKSKANTVRYCSGLQNWLSRH